MSKRKNLFLLFILMLFTGLSFNSYAGPVHASRHYIGETEAFAIADHQWYRCTELSMLMVRPTVNETMQQRWVM